MENKQLGMRNRVSLLDSDQNHKKCPTLDPTLLSSVSTHNRGEWSNGFVGTAADSTEENEKVSRKPQEGNSEGTLPCFVPV